MNEHNCAPLVHVNHALDDHCLDLKVVTHLHLPGSKGIYFDSIDLM
jgi:hypothetical protein